jgi:hypothetical protein
MIPCGKKAAFIVNLRLGPGGMGLRGCLGSEEE